MVQNRSAEFQEVFPCGQLVLVLHHLQPAPIPAVPGGNFDWARWKYLGLEDEIIPAQHIRASRPTLIDVQTQAQLFSRPVI